MVRQQDLITNEDSLPPPNSRSSLLARALARVGKRNERAYYGFAAVACLMARRKGRNSGRPIAPSRAPECGESRFSASRLVGRVEVGGCSQIEMLSIWSAGN